MHIFIGQLLARNVSNSRHASLYRSAGVWLATRVFFANLRDEQLRSTSFDLGVRSLIRSVWLCSFLLFAIGSRLSIVRWHVLHLLRWLLSRFLDLSEIRRLWPHELPVRDTDSITIPISKHSLAGTKVAPQFVGAMGIER